MSTIYACDEKTGKINRLCSYSISPKRALVTFIMQFLRRNYNTWEYPDSIPGMRESSTVKDHWYFDDFENQRVLAAYPEV